MQRAHKTNDHRETNIQQDVRVNHWLVGTRTLDTYEKVEEAFTEMATINVKLVHFARWIRQNKVAKILWLLKRYKTTNPRVCRRILWSNNVSEVYHLVLKGFSDYFLTKCKGLDLDALTKFLEHHDNADYKNFHGEIGLPLGSTPFLNRVLRNRKRNEDGRFDVIDGDTVRLAT